MRDTAPLIVGAVIAVFAQIIIAPNIALFSSMPNFLLVYVLVVAVVRPAPSVYVLGFVLGLLFDLLGYGPIGSMSCLMVLAAFVVSRVFVFLNNDTAFMPLVILVVAACAVEMLYAMFLVNFGFAPGVLEAFLYRALPCALYDCVAALIFYPLAMRFLVSNVSAPHAPSTSPIVTAAGGSVKHRSSSRGKRLR